MDIKNETLPVLCCRILQILDSEKRFNVPYGTYSPFAFAFRDLEFLQPTNRSHRYYMALRRCKDIQEYRQQVCELYQDDEISVEVNGEQKKFPIQIINVPQKDHQNLLQLAKQNNFVGIPEVETPLVLLCTLPLPRLLASPPIGKYRRDYLTNVPTNKIIDFGILIPENLIETGKKYFSNEISKCLTSVESTISFASNFAQRLKSCSPKTIGISIRGSMADNPVLNEDSFRVPASYRNFWEMETQESWTNLDIDLDLFCDEDDFDEIYKFLNDEELFSNLNVDIKGLRVSEHHTGKKNFRDKNCRSLDIYLMSDEWVFKSVQRYLHLGLEQPWAYYYASSYPLDFQGWESFLSSLYCYIGASI